MNLVWRGEKTFSPLLMNIHDFFFLSILCSFSLAKRLESDILKKICIKNSSRKFKFHLLKIEIVVESLRVKCRPPIVLSVLSCLLPNDFIHSTLLARLRREREYQNLTLPYAIKTRPTDYKTLRYL